MLHGPDSPANGLVDEVAAWMRDRAARSPVGVRADRAVVQAGLDGAISDGGLGVGAAWERFSSVVAPNNLGLDSERFLAFIPMSPSVASVWMDAVVGASSFSAESWMEAAGAVGAETQVIELFAGIAGMPEGSGGAFVSGGTIGNLSALAVAREVADGRRTVVVGDTAHASIDNALHLLGLQALVVPTGPDARLTGDAVRRATAGRTDIAAVVAAGGSTNAGIIDDLDGCSDAATELGAWFHVDGAYGLAAMLLPELRERFAGIERADSFIVDPHKWLFATAGSCALVYRQPALARAVHTQRGPYIEVLHTDDDTFNPCDLGVQLTRRASGLPIWFALVAHGLEAHREAIRVGIERARQMAAALDGNPLTELVLAPELGVVLFRRSGWGVDQWRAWAERLLVEQVAFVAPSTFRGEVVGRLVFMHPRTPASIVEELMTTLTG